MTKPEADILQYLDLIDRRLYIIMHSGVSWQPEYALEMDQIDKELLRLREELGMGQIKEGEKE